MIVHISLAFCFRIFRVILMQKVNFVLQINYKPLYGPPTSDISDGSDDNVFNLFIIKTYQDINNL